MKQMAEYTPEVEDGEEWKVKKVMEHKEYRRKGLWFVVEWATGEITEEPVDVFIDIVDGKKIWNEKVLKYAKRHKVNLDVTRPRSNPLLKRWEGDHGLRSLCSGYVLCPRQTNTLFTC